MIIAFRANRRGCRNVTKLLQSFSGLTGLSINYNKSAIYFSNWAGRQFRRDVCSWLGVQEVSYPLKYLGDLISDSRVTVRQQQVLVDKARGKLAGWKADVLSQAGRFTLVQAVLQVLFIVFLPAGLPLPSSTGWIKLIVLSFGKLDPLKAFPLSTGMLLPLPKSLVVWVFARLACFVRPCWLLSS